MHTTTLDPLADLLRAHAVLADLADLPRSTADPVGACADAFARFLSDDPRPGDAGIAHALTRAAAVTRCVPFADADTPDAFVRRVVLAIAHDIADRHEQGTVSDPRRRQGNRPAARRERTRSGQTVPIVDRSPLDAAERDSLALVRSADALLAAAGQSLPLLGSVKGHTPREVTPRLGRPVQVDGVTMSDGSVREIGSPVTMWQAADAIGRTVDATHVAKLHRRVETRVSRPDHVVWHPAPGRPGVVVAEQSVSIARPTDDGRIARDRAKVTGHGAFRWVARSSRHTGRDARIATAAQMVETLASLAPGETLVVGALTIARHQTDSTRGAPRYVIAPDEAPVRLSTAAKAAAHASLDQ